MGISGLDHYLASAKLLQTASLSALRDTRLGIDLALYLRTILSDRATAEPYVAALSGSPFAVIAHIEEDLRALERQKIKPVFILSGLPPQRRTRPFTFPDPRAELRRKAWARYEAGDVDGTTEDLLKSNSVREGDLVRAILRAFRHRNVEFLVAPYMAEGQLVSLERHSKAYVHAIYGSTSVFLFDRVDKLVTSLNLRSGHFTFASKAAVMQNLQCNEEEFLDMGLLCGFDFCPTFPPVMDGTIQGVMLAPAARQAAIAAASAAATSSGGGASSGSGSSSTTGGTAAGGATPGGTVASLAWNAHLPAPNPRAIMDIVKQHRSGFTACTAYAEHPGMQKTGYIDTFCRARCMIKFCLVLSAEEGRVLPLPLATPPPPLVTATSAAAAAGPGAPHANAAGVGMPSVPAPPPSLPTAVPLPPSGAATPAMTPTMAATLAPGVNGTTPAVPTASSSAGGAPIPTAADVPLDMHEIFSHRLPDEVFMHLSRGLISPTVLSYLTSGTIVEPPPLSPDAGGLEAYRRFMRDTITESHHSPRCVALALTVSALNTFWSGRKVSAIYWWDPTRDHPVHHESQATQQIIRRTANWNVPVAFVEEELRRQNSSTIDFALCLGSTGSETLAARTRTPRRVLAAAAPNGQQAPVPGAATNGKKTAAASASGGGSTATAAAAAVAPAQSTLDKKDEIVANVIWRFLELRGFLNHDHLHTPWARALHLALKASRLNDKLQEPLYVALELVRAGALHGSPYGGRVLSGGPTLGEGGGAETGGGGNGNGNGGGGGAEAQRARAHLLLVMRALSLLPMTFKPQPWTAPMSRELLLFSTFGRALHRSLRVLVESITSAMVLRGEARRSRDDLLDIGLSLPFQADANTGMGVVVKCYVEGLLTVLGGAPVRVGDEAKPEVLEAKAAVLHALEDTFENVRDVAAELRRGLRFWSSLMKAIETLKAEKSIAADLVRQFESADEWLRPMASF